ncbi:DUF6975 family protein [Sphingomonas mesophila]|uniref:DUF6975 family protein n=1 Tax=Sphingomonas mesophila TaxID=2303576 RepID=UPI001F084170|nr:hypothetical protein [Sphingomonas mesophila]
MATNPARATGSVDIVATHLARVAGSGLTEHAYARALITATSPTTSRDLADAVHLLCAIHGKFPGLADIASTAAASPVRDWLRATADAFERERLFLVRLTSSVGPLPSTPGSAATESALVAQRRAIETLARSERTGCALGATTALVHDWRQIRAILDKAAERAGMDCPDSTLPDDGALAEAIALGTEGAASERALAFGAEQLQLQHRALFDLLEARAGAREDF